MNSLPAGWAGADIFTMQALVIQLAGMSGNFMEEGNLAA